MIERDMTTTLRRSPIVRLASALAVVLALVATITVGLSANPDRAAAQSTNLYDQMNDGAWSVATSTNLWAQSFTTSSTATTLTSVEVWIRNNSGSPSSYSLALHSSAAGVPGTSLKTIVASEPVGQWGDGRKPFPLSTPVALAASTQYFIVMSGPAGGTVGWKCNAAAPSSDVTPTPTFVNKSSSNGGSSWSAVGGGCAGNNYNLIVTGAVPVAPTLGSFANVNATFGDSSQTITAPSANTAGSFAYSSSDTAVATVSGTTLTFVGAGTSTITADFTPTDTANWTTASTTMTVTVASPPPTTTTTTSTTTTSTTTTTVPQPPVTVAPTTTTTVTPAVVPAPTTTTSTTTTSTVASPPDARCPQWWSLAVSVGFTLDEMTTLDRILFVESRCDETQLNATDPHGGSVGLTQINRFWCLPSRYYADGYLQAVGVLTDCDELYQPEINLRAALALVAYSRSVGLDAWAQWAWLHSD